MPQYNLPNIMDDAYMYDAISSVAFKVELMSELAERSKNTAYTTTETALVE